MPTCVALDHSGVQLREKEVYHKYWETGGLSGGEYLCVSLCFWLVVRLGNRNPTE